jgi:hypothetical protein
MSPDSQVLPQMTSGPSGSECDLARGSDGLPVSSPGESSERPLSPGQIAHGMSQPGFGSSSLPGAPGAFTIAS